MTIVKIVKIDNGKLFTYYGKTKNKNKYLITIRSKSKKYEPKDSLTVFDLVKNDDFSTCEIVDKNLSDNELLKNLIDNDKNCINKYKRTFDKKVYDLKYRKLDQDKKFHDYCNMNLRRKYTANQMLKIYKDWLPNLKLCNEYRNWKIGDPRIDYEKILKETVTDSEGLKLLKLDNLID